MKLSHIGETHLLHAAANAERGLSAPGIGSKLAKRIMEKLREEIEGAENI